MSKPKRYYNQYKRYCCVYGCINRTNKELNLSFFNVPKDIERRREWLTAIDREDLLDDKNLNKAKYNYVCSVHFDDSAIMTSTSRLLKSDAVPTKLLPRSNQSDARNLEITIKGTPTQAVSNSSKDLSSNFLKKGNISVSTYSHTQSQTETQAHKALPCEKEIEPEIVKPNTNIISKQLNKLEHKPTVPSQLSPPTNNVSEPTTTTSQSQIKILISSNKKNEKSTSTQTDLHETSNKMTQTIDALSDKSSRKRKLRKDIQILKCKRKRLEQEVLKIQKELESKNASLLSDSKDEVTQSTD